MPMTRRQGITNRSKAKSQNARKRGPTPGFPAKSNTLSRQLLPISQADLHSSRTTIDERLEIAVSYVERYLDSPCPRFHGAVSLTVDNGNR
jgi:hypothetical protein